MSLLSVMSAAQVQQQQQAQSYGDAVNDPNAQYDGLMCQLDAYIESCWQSAKTAKEMNVEPDMLEDIRQRNGVYSDTKLQEIRQQGGSEIFMQLTNVKCRAFESWLTDLLLPSGERPFTLKAPPMDDDIPSEVKTQIYNATMTELAQAVQSGLYVSQQQVYERARSMYDIYQRRVKDDSELKASRMEDAIDAALVKGQWYEALEDFCSDLSGMKAAFIKGPVVRKQRRIVWKDNGSGKSVPMAEDELCEVFYSPNPLDMYPAPDSKGIDDGYLLERIRARRSAISAMKGVPGYRDEKITAALDEYQRHGHDLVIAGDQQRRQLTGQSNWISTPDNAIDMLEFHGSVRGQWLKEWGMPDSEGLDDDAEYEVTALRIGRHTVRVVFNEDPLGRRPYDKACFDLIKGEFWGRSLPGILKGIQQMCNAAARALQNNMGIASGPLVEIEVDRLAEGEDITQIYPWRIVQTKSSKTNTPSPAVRFTNVESIAETLMKVFDYFSKMADNYSGLPSYEQGINPTTGAAGTASGLSMLMTAATRQIKRVVKAVDRVIEGSVMRMHTHLFLYSDNQDIKGEADIEARGAASLVAKEQQQMRRTQLLQATANPFDMQILGVNGRAELWRETLKAMDLNPDSIIPSKDELLAKQRQEEQQQQMMQQMQMQAAGGGGGDPNAPPNAQGAPAQQQQPPGRRAAAPQARIRHLDHAGNASGGGSHNLITPDTMGRAA